MIYTIEKADLLAEQLRKFTSGFAFHVSGQFENIDFWISEVNGALATLDDYNRRFENIKNAQNNWIEKHEHSGATAFCPICRGKCELTDGKPAPPKRTSSEDIKSSRKRLTDNTYFFLIRCYNVGLLTQSELEAKCIEFGTTLEPSDLKKTILNF